MGIIYDRRKKHQDYVDRFAPGVKEKARQEKDKVFQFPRCDEIQDQGRRKKDRYKKEACEYHSFILFEHIEECGFHRRGVFRHDEKHIHTFDRYDPVP